MSTVYFSSDCADLYLKNMMRDGILNMYKKLLLLGLILTALSNSVARAESSNGSAPPIPARIGGSVTVNGILLTQETDSGYTIVVTKADGSEYNPAAQDTDGLNGLDCYTINIPIL